MFSVFPLVETIFSIIENFRRSQQYQNSTCGNLNDSSSGLGFCGVSRIMARSAFSCGFFLEALAARTSILITRSPRDCDVVTQVLLSLIGRRSSLLVTYISPNFLGLPRPSKFRRASLEMYFMSTYKPIHA